MKQFFQGTIVLAAACSAAGVAAASDPVAGRTLARDLCSGCHLVVEGQSGPVSDGVPAFRTLARDDTMTDKVLRGFIVDPHPQMPNVSLTTTEIDAIIAYIRSLGPL